MSNNRVGSRSASRNVPPPSPKVPPVNQHSASVPISLYREVAAELQTAKVMLDSLNTQNQQLTKQNQQLRLEIERVVQVALRLRQVADSHQPVPPSATRSASVEVGHSLPEFPPEAPPVPEPPVGRSPARTPAPRQEPVRVQRPKPEPVEQIPFSEALFTEEPELPYDHHQDDSKPDFSGWWLAIVILMIVVSAFGAGFVIVRPFLPSR